MDVAFLIRQRLEELGLDQRDLARAAKVTESYVSQLLTGRKAPPAPDRTDIYDRMDRFLKLPHGELGRVAEEQRLGELKRRLGAAPAPRFPGLRDLMLGKCPPAKLRQLRAIFERQAFGELERLVAHKLLDVAQRAAKRDLVGAEVLHLSARQIGVLDGLIESWDVDLATFALTIEMKARIVARPVTRLEFVERDTEEERGLRDFLRDSALSGTATAEELAFLKGLRFGHRRPTALYYYREMQNLRDPLHFHHP